jgi:cell fate regulator YaaT (PSP1 superfamily)
MYVTGVPHLYKNIIGVKFREEGEVYQFNALDLPLKKGDQVIVSTDTGLAIGTVVTKVKSVPLYKLPIGLKPVTRLATEEDLKIKKNNKILEKEVFQFCKERINARELPMKLVDVNCYFDRSQIVFYFTADNRVDFRELVKDLVQKFKTRIELRQISARQEARIIKGMAMCGREVCCANMLIHLDRVSVKMAKEQSIALNPERISGLCGRLMCCLAFEFDSYLDMKKNMPKCGKRIQTPEGRAKVIRHNALQGEIAVELENGKEISINIKDL